MKDENGKQYTLKKVERSTSQSNKGYDNVLCQSSTILHYTILTLHSQLLNFDSPQHTKMVTFIVSTGAATSVLDNVQMTMFTSATSAQHVQILLLGCK